MTEKNGKKPAENIHQAKHTEANKQKESSKESSRGIQRGNLAGESRGGIQQQDISKMRSATVSKQRCTGQKGG
jgi:hypothetical protein